MAAASRGVAAATQPPSAARKGEVVDELLAHPERAAGELHLRLPVAREAVVDSGRERPVTWAGSNGAPIVATAAASRSYVKRSWTHSVRVLSTAPRQHDNSDRCSNSRDSTSPTDRSEPCDTLPASWHLVSPTRRTKRGRSGSLTPTKPDRSCLARRCRGRTGSALVRGRWPRRRPSGARRPSSRSRRRT